METINGDVTVNDGGGLLDSSGLIDSLIVDCNGLTKSLIDNQFIQFASTLVQMVQKLSNLKKGIKSDHDSLREQIKELKKLNDDLAEKAHGLPVDRGEDGA